MKNRLKKRKSERRSAGPIRGSKQDRKEEEQQATPEEKQKLEKQTEAARSGKQQENETLKLHVNNLEKETKKKEEVPVRKLKGQRRFCRKGATFANINDTIRTLTDQQDGEKDRI